MRCKAVAIALACLIATIWAVPASSQALTEGLQYALTPTVWGTGMDGDVQLGAFGGQVGEGPGEDLNGALRFEAKGPVWTLRAEIVVGGNEHDLENATGTLDADLMTAELVSGWQFSESAELVFGARYYESEAELSFAAPVPGSGGLSQFESDQSWVDPVVGIFYGGDLARYWTYHFRLDVGGFGVGSDLAVNGRFEFGYQFNDSVSLQFGYRILDIDYDNNSYIYDILQQGPEIGLRFAF